MGAPGGDSACLVRGGCPDVQGGGTRIPLEAEDGVYISAELPTAGPCIVAPVATHDSEADMVEQHALDHPWGEDDAEVSEDDFVQDAPCHEVPRSASAVKPVVAPSAEARALHLATGHAEFANWCEHWVAGKRKELPHRRLAPTRVRTPAISAYYYFHDRHRDGYWRHDYGSKGSAQRFCLR